MAHDVIRPAAAIAPQPRWAHPHADLIRSRPLRDYTPLRAQRTYYAGRQERGNGFYQATARPPLHSIDLFRPDDPFKYNNS